MVRNGDEGTRGEGVESLGVMNVVAHVHHRVGQHGGGEGGATQVAMLGVDGVDLVDGEPFHQPASDGDGPSVAEDGRSGLQIGQAEDGLHVGLLTHAGHVRQG